jgi:hypothetical protein
VVVALGIIWLLDGLEGNLAGFLAGVLKGREPLGLTDAQIGLGCCTQRKQVRQRSAAEIFRFLIDK